MLCEIIMKAFWRFLYLRPTQLTITVPVDGSGLMSNVTPRKSLMHLSASISYGDSFPTQTFETSGSDYAQSRNNKPYKQKNRTTVNNNNNRKRHRKLILLTGNKIYYVANNKEEKKNPFLVIRPVMLTEMLLCSITRSNFWHRGR